MSESNINAVRSMYEAFGRRDQAAITAALAPDVEFVQTGLLPWGGEHKGVEGARNFFTRLTSAVDSHLDIEELVDAGESVVVIAHTRGTAKASAKEFSIRAVHVWSFRDGKVISFRAYIDTPAMLQALKN